MNAIPIFSLRYNEFTQKFKMGLVHTETEPDIAGQGAAKAVVEKTLHFLDIQNVEVLPFCPYVFAYIKKHPEWKRIVSPKHK